MPINENLERFNNLPVVDWEGDGQRIDFAKAAVRVRIGYDEAEEGVTFIDKLATLLEADGSDRIESLVIGAWQAEDSGIDSSEVVEALVSARQKLPRLRNLFLGDIMMEECEISWVRQSDMSSLVAAYEAMERLTVRGGENLSFGTLRHQRLKELILQTGGLPPGVIHEICAARLPALEHLELWLGEPNYGGDATVDDLAPLLKGDLFPRLRFLGLKDSVIQDEIAGVIALAPVLNQLEVLDLSMGTLTDAGGKALLASPAIRRLKKLDLHHHYMSPEMMTQFQQLGIEVNVDDVQEPDDWGNEQHRYIAVSE